MGGHPWVRKIPWKRKWKHTPVFLPGKFCGQRNLVGYSLWGLKEPDKTDIVSNIIKILFGRYFRINNNNMSWTFLNE